MSPTLIVSFFLSEQNNLQQISWGFLLNKIIWSGDTVLALFQTNKPAVFLSQGANSWALLLRKSVRNGFKIIWLQKRSCWRTSLHPGLSTSWCVLACSGWPAFTGFRTTLSPITTCIHMEHCGKAKNVKQGWGRPFRGTKDKNNEAHDEKLFLFQFWNLSQDFWNICITNPPSTWDAGDTRPLLPPSSSSSSCQ